MHSSLPRPGPLLSAILVIATRTAAQTAPGWRYDLHPGDRLVYSYSFSRQVHTDEAETAVEARFHTQVLIAGEREGVLSAGFQRNRDNADLLLYRIRGKDKLAEERPNFEKRMKARPAQFSEAMEFTSSGEPRYSWEVVRESASHLLPALHEIEVLPPNAVKTSDRWHARNLLGIDFECVGSEQVHGKSCFHVRGVTSDGSVTLSYWWSPESHVIERFDLDGSYAVPGGTSHEQARMELELRSRNETPSDWLSKPETRLGGLEAFLLSPWLGATAGELASASKTGDPAAQRLALAVAYHRGLPLSDAGLNGSTNPEVKLLANEILKTPVQQPEPVICSPPTPSKATPTKFGTLFRVVLPEKPGLAFRIFCAFRLYIMETVPSHCWFT